MTPRNPGQHALVIGATGGIGGAIARALLARGWSIAALNRNPATAAARSAGLAGAEWIDGDAMNPDDVRRAAEGARLIVHGANPPGYRNWQGTVVPMLRSSIAAAASVGARIVFPGTVYNYGPDAGAIIAEDAPQNPVTRKGRLRVAMEQTLEDSGVATLIVRAGDFFAPWNGNSWFSQGLIRPGAPLRSIAYPGPHAVGHQWAYLPDLAETFARLVERESALGRFERFHFGGHWLERGSEIAEAVRRVAGRPDLPIRSLPWWALRFIAPFNETFREMLEMRYLWQRPVRLENAKLVAFLGSEPHTPLDIAVRDTLAALGCLKQPIAPVPRERLAPA